MPFDEYTWIDKSEVLSFEEITRIVGAFSTLGVDKVRLTGGEPLLRKNLHELVQRLVAVAGIQDISLTTNGTRLGEQAGALYAAGLRRINISLDTLVAERFRQLTQRGNLADVLGGLEAARKAGFDPIKINAVVIRGFNEDEVLPLAEFARQHGYEMRFIEYMDVGNANGWSLDKTFTKAEILAAIHARHPVREIGRQDDRAPAVDYAYLDGGGQIGIIGSVTEPFCTSCTRVRLTADGQLVTCLFASSGFNLKGLLRSGATDLEIRQTVSDIWAHRKDRFSDERWAILKSGNYDPQKRHKIEMITLGG